MPVTQGSPCAVEHLVPSDRDPLPARYPHTWESDDEQDDPTTGASSGIGKATARYLAMASEQNVVVRAIYEAATDGINQLRYTAGEDAKRLARVDGVNLD